MQCQFQLDSSMNCEVLKETDKTLWIDTKGGNLQDQQHIAFTKLKQSVGRDADLTRHRFRREG